MVERYRPRMPKSARPPLRKDTAPADDVFTQALKVIYLAGGVYLLPMTIEQRLQVVGAAHVAGDTLIKYLLENR